LLDFKSGEAESDLTSKLDQREMKLQLSLYGLAAKRELEYEPERGLVRYLDEEDPAKAEILVDLSDDQLEAARVEVTAAARRIRDREFHIGPISGPRDPDNRSRCAECDFREFCGKSDAVNYRQNRP
jgi:DNA helicase-2/ATP-dependent DNA helicase PcrA